MTHDVAISNDILELQREQKVFCFDK